MSLHPKAGRVFPYFVGGLGNQLFISSAALVIANRTGRHVLVDAEQTGVHSFGVPQPVYWSTVFHSESFVKTKSYLVPENAYKVSEEDFRDGLQNNFDKLQSGATDVIVSSAFLHFTFFADDRELLKQSYAPSAEVQRWVNDAAVKMGLALPTATSSLPASSVRQQIGHKDMFDESLWSCERPPNLCNRKHIRASCFNLSCADNVAVQIRLTDRSSHKDHFSGVELQRVNVFIHERLENPNTLIVVFSNDPKRASKLLMSTVYSPAQQARMIFSEELSVVDFYLMSQFFGTHVLSGSTFQLWSIFLSPLDVSVMIMDGIEDHGLRKLSENILSPHITFTNL